MRTVTYTSVFFILNCSASFLANSQSIPAIVCPNYFQYFTEGSQYIGRITLPNIGYGTTKLDIRLSQRSPLQNNNYGKISLYETYNDTIARIEHRQPIYYRVTFPTAREIPKLTLIAVNGQTLCQDRPYAPPSINIALDHKLTSMSTAFVPGIQSRFGGDLATSQTRPQQSHTPLSTLQQTFASRGQVNNFLATPSTQGFQYLSAQPTANLNFDCGREGVSRTLTPFIYGGRELFRGQYPWLTAIYLKRAEGLLYICGGSLVSTRSVVTAAHCFEKTGLKANQVLVVLGHHDLNNFSEEGDVKLELLSLRMHPEYNSNLRSDADIAILHLKSPVRFTSYIQPICLWRESDDVNLIAGHKASVAGWGADEQHVVSPVPKAVEVDVAGDNECQQALQSSGKVRSICVSNENGDGPCRGDSGGGLIMKRNGRWTLRGVVSSGLTRGGRCYLSEFVYFCDLAKHSSWVRSNIL